MRNFSFLSHGTSYISEPNSRTTLRDLWLARYIVIQLMWRDLTVRYRQTWLGWLWAIFSPLMNLAMYYMVFGLLVRLSPPDYSAPYVLVLLSGILVWILFQSTVNVVSDSLLNNIHLVKKIYFPRTVLTLAGTGVSLCDFAIALMLFVCLSAGFGLFPSLAKAPLLLLCTVLIALSGWGLGCLLAVAKIRFRDVRHIMPLLMQSLFYASPVVWTPGLISPHFQDVLAFNPLYGLIALFRYVLLCGPQPSLLHILWTLLGCVVVSACGYRIFICYEAKAIDRE
ncbi:MAG: ABC transporter permease [Hafnia sp.]|uniref:ABC transporter permease n=1 Tax=Hafnia sp. TaxID=1873498 RepID=UPI002FC95EAB